MHIEDTAIDIRLQCVSPKDMHRALAPSILLLKRKGAKEARVGCYLNVETLKYTNSGDGTGTNPNHL